MFSFLLQVEQMEHLQAGDATPLLTKIDIYKASKDRVIKTKPDAKNNAFQTNEGDVYGIIITLIFYTNYLLSNF